MSLAAAESLIQQRRQLVSPTLDCCMGRFIRPDVKPKTRCITDWRYEVHVSNSSRSVNKAAVVTPKYEKEAVVTLHMMGNVNDDAHDNALYCNVEDIEAMRSSGHQTWFAALVPSSKSAEESDLDSYSSLPDPESIKYLDGTSSNVKVKTGIAEETSPSNKDAFSLMPYSEPPQIKSKRKVSPFSSVYTPQPPKRLKRSVKRVADDDKQLVLVRNFKF